MRQAYQRRSNKHENRGYPFRGTLIFFLGVSLLLGSFSGCRNSSPDKYSDSFTGCFDTVIQVIAYTPSKQDFESYLAHTKKRFTELHELYDIYHAYPGINNLHTINEKAGLEPVKVSGEIIDLLLFARDMDNLTPGTVNIAFGPVLEIWHDVRTRALNDDPFSLPEQEALEAAAQRCDQDDILVDPEAETVFLTKTGMKLDVGAIAKGFATDRIARELEDMGLTSGIISAGGSNVRLIGKPDDDRETWHIGLQDPDGNPLIPDDEPLDVLLINDQSIVTSGDYQRYFTCDGVIYHHLIDTRTLQPARYFRAVTVVTPDSARADFLSTALFLLPYEEGRQIADHLVNCDVLWILHDGSMRQTDGIKNYLESAQSNH